MTQIDKENKRNGNDNQIPGSSQIAKKAEEHEGYLDTHCSWCS